MRLFATVGLMIATAFTQARAQPPVERDSSGATAKAIAAAVKNPLGMDLAVRTLRQVDRRLRRDALDEIADSLVALAIQLTPTRSTIGTIQSAVGALGLASLAEGDGVPYAGGAERLLRVAEAGGGHAGGALSALSRLPDQEVAIASMKRVAVSDNVLASEAVRYLGAAFGSPGVAVLERIYRNREIRDGIAMTDARRYARRAGWPDPPA